MRMETFTKCNRVTVNMGMKEGVNRANIKHSFSSPNIISVLIKKRRERTCLGFWLDPPSRGLTNGFL